MEGYSHVNYGGVVLSKITRDDLKATLSVKEHTLLFIHSGVAEIVYDDKRQLVHAGEGIFLLRGRHVIVNTCMGDDGRPFESIALYFCRKFLLAYYKKLPVSEQCPVEEKAEVPYGKVPSGPALSSLFLSLIPYLESNIDLSPEIAWAKRWEGMRCVLDSLPEFYPSVFNFVQPWKVDLVAFMEENWKYDMSLPEMAMHTGRSLSAFKRDFRKVSDLTPERWIVNRRLEEANSLLSQGKGRSVMDVMFEVGFKDMSTFSRAYGRKYGYPPSRTPGFR